MWWDLHHRKSTLARRAAQTLPGEPITFAPQRTSRAAMGRYLTLDDATTLAAIESDPEGFLAADARDWTVIDEVQRVPALMIAVKRAVDADRRPGRFLLTGSTNVMTIPHISESLAGRVEILDLWPLAQCEIENTSARFLSWAFSDEPAVRTGAETRGLVVERALKGGYPDAFARSSRSRRNAWFGSYLATVIQREIKTISNIDDEAAIVRTLRALASRSGGPRNIEALAGDVATPASTVRRYVELLKLTFLISELPPWSGGLDARIVRSPKMLINDPGLYGHLLNLSPGDSQIGLLIEDFIGTELSKLISFEGVGEFTLMHFRTHRQNKVDFVVESGDRRIVGIEAKAASTVTNADFRGLRALADAAKGKLHRGIVFYCGDRSVPFGSNMWAVPIGALWS
ncbi:MAG: ATP-binding protein [Vulcanimicrobiaceae bacterium]